MINIWSWYHISFKGHVTMIFETDMMSCDPDLLVFWCMAHTPKVFGVWAINHSKDERPTHLIRDKMKISIPFCLELSHLMSWQIFTNYLKDAIAQYFSSYITDIQFIINNLNQVRVYLFQIGLSSINSTTFW